MHEHRVRKYDSRPQRFSTRGFIMMLVLFAITSLLAVASTADSAAAVTQRADHERSDHELYGWNTNLGREKRQIDEEGNATINLVPCPCNSENCFTFEDDNGTEMCSCIPGFEQQMTNQNGQVCTDVDECISSSHDCGTGICINTLGSYACVCPPGYVFNIDSRQCVTIVTAIDYSSVIIPRGFLPFGPDYGDSRVPTALDGSTDEIQLETDIIIFRSHQNRLYVSTNGLLSFGQSFFSFSSFGLNFDSISSPPLIAPFWDDVDVTRGGRVYYRQDNTSSIAEQIQQDISLQFHNIGLFYPSLVFVATWDRVASYRNRGVVNTFQVVIASDGTRTFVRFNYGDIQWGGPQPWSLIGVSFGDRANFITHPASLSPSVLSLDNYTTKYFEVGFLESAAIRFNSSIYTVSEDDSCIDLIIVKNISDAESTTENITVHFITSDLTAKASEDYYSTNLTVTFRPDESEKLIQVPIINDLSREESETFYGNLTFYYQSELLQQVQFAGLTASIEILYNDCDCDCTNSSCSCHNGYFGNGFICLDDDECAIGLHDCDINANCVNTNGSFECTCNDGFLGDGKTCISNSTTNLVPCPCNSSENCFTFEDDSGTEICSCKPGFEQQMTNQNGQVCTDVDECISSSYNCGTGTCTNIPGSYICVCPSGYVFNIDSQQCVDLDECKTDMHHCDENADCSNTEGSYDCTCHNGFTGNGLICLNNSDCETLNCSQVCANITGSLTCACHPGYVLNTFNLRECEDLDECDLRLDTCDINAECTNRNGSYECQCNSGYRGNGWICNDIDECATGLNDCAFNLICHNSNGSYDCGSRSEPIIEPIQPERPNHNLYYTVGNDFCLERVDSLLPNIILKCSLMEPDPLVNFTFVLKSISLAPEDFNMTGVLLLMPITLPSVDGTFNASQMSPFPLEFKNVFYSDDVNISVTCFATNTIGEDNATTHITVCGPTECQDGITNNCTQTCNRTVSNGTSSYECGCYEGYELDSDNTTCVDIDHCASNPCHLNATCTNTRTSYDCKCDTGYEENGTNCQEIPSPPGPNINSSTTQPIATNTAINSSTTPPIATNTAINLSTTPPITTILTINSSTFPPLTPIANSERLTDTIIISSTIGAVAFLLLIAVLVLIICFFRKSFAITKKKNDLLFRNATFSDQYDGSPRELNRDFFPRTISVQSSYKLNLPRHLLIHASDIKLVEPIGQGEFGIVYKGYIIKKQGNIVTDTVAVKTLKGMYNRNTVREMLKECSKMYNFNHPNVLTLRGVCLDGGTAPYIIMPFMANGSLLAYLKKNRQTLVVSLSDKDEDDVTSMRKRLMDMCIQVAKGMEYLAGKKMVHRDLAARNCMIDVNFVIKVADFGLAESVETREYFRQDKSSHIKLPLKWLAPESMEDYVFSEKSDVWAYGVTCWEIFSGGKVPYGGVTITDLSRLLADGHRLEKPNNDACSDQLYQLLLQCWEFERVDRPQFADIVSTLSESLGAMAGYLDIGAFSGESTVVEIKECSRETLELVEEQSLPQASSEGKCQDEATVSDESTV